MAVKRLQFLLQSQLQSPATTFGIFTQYLFYWIRISIMTVLSLNFFLTKIKVAVEKLKNLENKFTQTFECILPNDHPCIQSSIQKSNGRHVLDFVEILSSFFKPMFECSWHPSNLQFLKCADKLQSIWNYLQLVAICNL